MVEWEGEHDLIVLGFFSACGRVEIHGGGVVTVGENPSFHATEIAGVSEEGIEELFAKALIAVSESDSDFVDPEFGIFVWMDVVDGGRHSDDQIVFDGDGEVMAGVCEELFADPFLDVEVKDVRSGVGEEREFVCLEQSDFGGGHSFGHERNS